MVESNTVIVPIQPAPSGEDKGADKVSNVFLNPEASQNDTGDTNDTKITEPVLDPNNISVSQADYIKVLQQARNYETIMADPNASAFLTRYYGEMAANTQPPITENKPQQISQEKPAGPVEARLAALESANNEYKEALRTMHSGMGRLALDNFRLQNPDYSNYVDEMRSIMQEIPQISPQKAYEFAKLRKGDVQSQNSQSRTTTASPTTEGKSASIPESRDFVSQAESRINSRKATPGDSYIDEAIKTARAIHDKR